MTFFCEAFGVMPSQVYQEDPVWVEKMKLVLSARNEMEQEKQRREQRRGPKRV